MMRAAVWHAGLSLGSVAKRYSHVAELEQLATACPALAGVIVADEPEPPQLRGVGSVQVDAVQNSGRGEPIREDERQRTLPPRPATPTLDRVRTPADLRNFSAEQLKAVADELRAETVDAVSTTGGHLGAALGVVELTVALHAVFDTPRDRLIWDVGHQAYPHKILTGRRDRIRTLRQPGGLSGFTRRTESEYDPFGAAHTRTTISAGLGMAVARELKGDEQQRRVP